MCARKIASCMRCLNCRKIKNVSTAVVTEAGDLSKRKRLLPRAPEGWLTRYQVQDLLDCSVNTVKNWESKGLLKAKICRAPNGDNHETHYYNPAQLALIPRKQNRLTGAGSPGEVVIALRYEPAVVEDLREQWLESNRKSMVVSERAKRELEQLFGGKEIRNENDLVQLTRAVVNFTGVTVEAIK